MMQADLPLLLKPLDEAVAPAVGVLSSDLEMIIAKSAVQVIDTSR